MVSHKKEIPATTLETQPTPADSLGLQTYEFFGGGDQRQERIRQFATGLVVQVELDYPELFSDEVDKHVRNLCGVVSPEGVGGIYSATPEYRLGEAYLLKAAQRLNDRVRPVGQSEIDSFQELNEAIYGKPDVLIMKQILSHIWESLYQKRVNITDPIIRELETGSIFTAENGESVEVPPLPRPNAKAAEADNLPELNPEALQWLKDTLESEFSSVKLVFDEYFAENILKREDTKMHPADIVEMFHLGINALGLEEVGVIEKADATALSWSSADGAVVIGMRRAPIESVDQLMGVFIHEVGVHGRRYQHGKFLGDDSLANGLFTEANTGEDPSYLTFEEGLGAVLQRVADGTNDIWSTKHSGIWGYLNIGLAHMGWSPRQIQEVTSRALVVLQSKDGQAELTETAKNTARKKSAAYLIRVFRGTPADEVLQTTEGITLHYAKDLAYTAGKFKAVNTLNYIATLPEAKRNEAWQHLFSGKFDPTNSRQSAYVESVVRGRI